MGAVRRVNSGSWRPPEDEDDDGDERKIPPEFRGRTLERAGIPVVKSRQQIQLGNRNQMNLLVAEGVQAAAKAAAKKAGIPQGMLVELAIMEYLNLVCEECGR